MSTLTSSAGTEGIDASTERARYGCAVEGRYRLVEVLRRLKVSDRHIRLTLYSELGLTPEEADEALMHGKAETESSPAVEHEDE